MVDGVTEQCNVNAADAILPIAWIGHALLITHDKFQEFCTHKMGAEVCTLHFYFTHLLVKGKPSLCLYIADCKSPLL